MRKDIEIHINTGDVTISPQNSFTLRDFEWVSNSEGSSDYLYGEIVLPYDLPENYFKTNGVYTTIPYTAKYKDFYVRFKREESSDSYTYIKNIVDGSEWFLVKTCIYGKSSSTIKACQLPLISEDSFFFAFNGTSVNLYASFQSDFNIVEANTQNKNMLLKCCPTNCYRYPLMGVGLSRWINSNIDYTNLAVITQREFANDGVTVTGMKYNYSTESLSVDLDTTNVDNE